MAIPSVMADLSTTAATNSPAGSESPSNGDDFLRAIQAIVRTTNAKGADIASSTTTDIGAATGEFVDVTGTTTITGLGTIAAGIVRTVRFTGELTLTHNATSLILPSSANITTANGDVAMFRSLGSGNWKCTNYIRQNGNALGVTDESITNAKIAFDGGAFCFRNDLINGNFEIDQTFIGVSTSHADDTYAMDGWYVLTQTAAINTTKQADQENGTPFNIRLTQAQAAAQRIGLAQIVESSVSKKRRGSAMVESLRIRASNGQAIRYAILEWTGTADTVTSDVVLDWTSASYTAGGFFLASNLTVTAVGTITPTANTWTDVAELTGTFGSSVNNSIVMVWTEGTAAQNFTLDIARFQLEKGLTKTAFEETPTQIGLTRCQRFWEKSYDLETALGAATATGVEAIRRSAASEVATVFNATFKVEKISIPGVSWYNASTGTINQIYNATGVTNITVTGTTGNVPISTKKVGAPSHAGNGAAGDLIIGHWTANSRL